MESFRNCGNLFARGNFILPYLANQHIIFTQQNNIKKYISLFQYYHTSVIPIDDISDLIDALFNNHQNYITLSDIFYLDLPNIYQLKEKYTLFLKKNMTIEIDSFIKKLNDFGYTHKEYLEGGNYKRNGDTIILQLRNSEKKILLSFWGDTIENMHILEKEEQIEVETFALGKIFPLENFGKTETFHKELTLLFKEKYCILDILDIHIGYEYFASWDNSIRLEVLKSLEKSQINLEVSEISIQNIEQLIEKLKVPKLQKTIYTKNITPIKSLIEYNNLEGVQLKHCSLNFLNSYQTPKEYVICDDIISKIFVKKRVKKTLSEDIDLMLHIRPGDFVVHIEHGIGIFHQILEKTNGDITREYIEIHYKNNDKLFVPITELKRISKYVGKENPELTGLDKNTWKLKLKKIQEDIQQTAEELLDIYAKRKILPGFSFILDENKMKDFQKSFEYDYTNDQIEAIKDILYDMSQPTPMERILVGDVGFGKTEVAFHAIFNAFLNKKQSILISPLVVLAYEHFQKARERFADFGVNVEVLTRFETTSQAKYVIHKLKTGEIDLIIGTHRLLNEDIEYKDLGLLVIDEEHKFGVKDKEKIKSMQGYIDILSMSATPIPRSLNMALSGTKDVSILSHPPANRKGVETFVCHFEDQIIIEASNNEFARGGQIFFIHNRVKTIEMFGKYLQELFPDKKIIITHGQLHGHDLEERILAFKRKEYDILLSSTVIENGIDFQNVNTIFINDAYQFGISQIHQLRGRVGRRDKKGYCYLLFKRDKLKEDAAKRLSTMVEYSHLGAGFELAVKDLEMRGGGDILGIRQSGQASEIGVTLYLKMLEEKIEELKQNIKFTSQEQNIVQQNTRKKIDTSIDLNVGAFLSDNYFSSELDKINFYREIESIHDTEELDNLIEDFSSVNGSLKKENINLFHILKLRIIAHSFSITSIKRVGVSYEIHFSDSITVEDLKKFLLLDTKTVFIVSNLKKLKTPCHGFKNDEEFLYFLLDLFHPNKEEKKRKIVKLK